MKRDACRHRLGSRRSSTGVRSAPPPNQALVVTTKRVFMCTAGTCGLRRCAISEMPEAQKPVRRRRPESAREFRREFAMYGRAVHADLLEQPAVHHRHHAAAAGPAAMVRAIPRRAHEAACAPRDKARPVRPSSSCSKAGANFVAQALRTSFCARALRSSMTDMSMRKSQPVVIASGAKQSRAAREDWIASSRSLSSGSPEARPVGSSQ